MEITRRGFLGGLGAAFATLTLPSPAVAAQAATDAAGNPIPKKTISNPYIYRFSIGEFEAWSISDGYGTFKQGVTNRMWPPAERPGMSKALAAEVASRNITVNCAAMESIGIAFADVTHALLSHSHIDHIGGLASGGKILFPNAAVHVLREEVDFWRGKEPDFSKSHRTDDIQAMIRNVRGSFDTLQPNLVIHKDGDQILDGAITILAAPGHTDGHAIFRIKSGDQSLLHISDLAHNHVLMFEDPAWFIDFDHNPEIAIATRRKIFAEIATTREHVYGFHLPWPGLGVVIPNGRKGYQWVASSHRWDF